MATLVGWAQTTVTFDATTDLGTYDGAGNLQQPDSVTKGGIEIKAGKGLLGNGTQYRFYKNQPMSIISYVGKITKVEITCTATGT